MKTYALFLSVICTLLCSSAMAQVPVISSISPNLGIPGNTVTINGSNFYPHVDSNYVFFGATRATITSASATRLDVTVPVGALYQLVSVVNKNTLSIGYQEDQFSPTYDSTCFIDTLGFKRKVDFSTASNPYIAAIADVDGDGKSDLVVINRISGTGRLEVMRNTSSGGGNVSFASPVGVNTASNPSNVKMADLDRDGKLDFVFLCGGSGQVGVLRNVSSSGSITFSSTIRYFSSASSIGLNELAVADFDNDGKTDIAAVAQGSDSIIVYRNLITAIPAGTAPFITASFATARHFYINPGSVSLSICTGDLDGDGLQDIAVSNLLRNTVSILRNTYSGGGLSFASFTTIATGSYPLEVQIADLNNDNKPEIIVTNNTGSSVSIFKNNSSSGSVSMATKVDFSIGGGPVGLAIGDVSGDGRPDIIATNSSDNTVSVLKNKITGASILSTSFDNAKTYVVGSTPYGVNLGDVDNDNKLDIVVANSTGSNLSILRNYPIPKIAPITGSTLACIGTNPTYSNTVVGGTWSVTNTTLATIDNITGVLTPISSGFDTVVYTVECQGDTNQVRFPIDINLGPRLGIIGGPSSICNNNTAVMTNTFAFGTWSSSNPLIATISSTGFLTPGTSTGTTTITYSATNICGTIDSFKNVTVNAAPTAITGTFNVCPDSTRTLGNTITGGTWSSLDPSIATIHPTTGVVRGVIRTGGSCSIRYTLTGGCFVSQVVTVGALPTVASITGPTGVCETFRITLSTSSTGGVWSSSNSSVAIINPTTGVVTGVSAGTDTIYYTLTNSCGRNSSRYIITVHSMPSTISGPTTVCVGSTITLSNTIGGGVWTAATGTNATVAFGTGIVSGRNPGTEVISYTLTAGSCATSTTITVNPVPSFISGTANVCMGTTASFSNSTTGGTWSTSNTSIAIIDASTGVLSPVATGSVDVIYTVAGCESRRTISIDPLPATITGGTSVCERGSSISLSSSGSGLWTSDRPAIASVGATTGMVTGGTVGTANITYTALSTGCFRTTTITVNPLPANIVGTPEVCIGNSRTLSNATAGGNWSSASGTIATVTSAGVFRGDAVGTTTVSYTLPTTGCFVTVPFTVHGLPAAITGLSSVCEFANITMSTSSTGGTWAITPSSVATITSTTGLVTGVGAGTASITYTLPTTCFITRSLTVVAAPAPIMGTTTLCVGSTSRLTDSTTGGFWSHATSTSSVATIDFSGLVRGLTAGVAVVSYTEAATGCSRYANITVLPIVTPSVTISVNPGTTVCAGSSVTYTAVPTNGGTIPTYNWLVNGTSRGSGVTFNYVPNNGDVVRCIMTSNAPCVTGATASSNLTMTVNPLLTPSVVLDIYLGDTVCVGAPTTVYAIPTNGGSAPNYRWRVNGIFVGTGNSFTYTPANGDIVNVVMSSNVTCRAVDTAFANKRITVSPYVTPMVTMHGQDTACEGMGSVLFATGTNTGFSPVYRWEINGVFSGTANPFSWSPVTGDVIVVKMSSSYPCVNYVTDSADTMTMSVFPVITPEVHVIVVPGFIVAPGMTAWFRADVIGGGSAPTYQWTRNGAAIPGATNSTYNTNLIATGDSFACKVVNTDICSNIAGWDAIRMVVGNNIGVNEVINVNESFTLFPNPNKGSFTLKGALTNNSSSKVHISVSNMLGQIVYQDDVMPRNGEISQFISLDEQLTSGMYIMQLQTDNFAKTIHFSLQR